MRKRSDITDFDKHNATSVFKHPFIRYIQRIKQDNVGDHMLSGSTLAKVQTLWEMIGLEDMAGRLLQEPGDRQITPEKKSIKPNIGLGKPIAYDVWYLFWAGNILSNGHSDYSSEEWIANSIEILYDFFHAIDSSDCLRALKQPVQDEKVTRTFTYPEGSVYPGTTIPIIGFAGMSEGAISNDVIADWKYTIKEAWFETILFNNLPCYPSLPRETTVPFEPYQIPTSPGGDVIPPLPPKEDTAPYQIGPKKPPGDGYCGYIAFPVGAMGTMWQIALTTSSALANGAIDGVHAADAETTTIVGKELYPPFDLQRKDVPGAKLIDKGYMIADDTTVEYPAQAFPGLENPATHGWLRYWIKKDNTQIVPGELVALVCRPYPDHCWWFQESSPLVYAGNWIETEFYTSGIVKCVLTAWTDDKSVCPTRADGDTTGYYDPGENNFNFPPKSKLYVVWVKNEEIIVPSSDWKEYETGDIVGLLKCARTEEGHINFKYGDSQSIDVLVGPGDNFDWNCLWAFHLKSKTTEDKDIFTTHWNIVPVDFYGATGGNTLGG